MLFEKPWLTLLESTAAFFLVAIFSSILRRKKTNLRAFSALVLIYAAPIFFLFFAYLTLSYNGASPTPDQLRRAFFLAGLFGYVLTALLTVVLWATLSRWRLSLSLLSVLAIVATVMFYFLTLW